jgi:uncharacterized protein YhjY with autotransporter beta-barrel domain
MSQAQDIYFKCNTTVNPITTAIVDHCLVEKIPGNALQLTIFASQVYDLLDNNIGNTEITSNCVFDPLTPGIANCSLDSPNPTPFNFTCVTGYDAASNPTASCQLTNAGFESVMKMDCKRELSGSLGGCVFKLDKTPILTQLQTANDFTYLTANQKNINLAFWSCVNRISSNTGSQSECDVLMHKLMDPTQTATVTDQLLNLFKAITPQSTDISLDISAANINSSVNNIRSRLTQLRSGIAKNAVNIQYYDGQQWLDANTLLAQNNISMSDISPEKPTKNISEYGKLGLFINGSAINSKQAANDIEGSHEANTQIATLGMDYRFSDAFVAGLAINLSQSTADYGGNAGKFDTDTTALILYTSYYINNWYIDASLNHGEDKYDQERNIDCSACPLAFIQSYTTDFSGSQTSLSLGAGYQWQEGASGITPFIQINGASIKTDAYTETPSSSGTGSNYALAISEQKRDTSSIKIGSNFQYTFGTRHGVVIPLIGLQAVHEFEGNANSVTGNFVGNVATDASFDLTTNDIDKNYFLISTGLNFQLKNGNAGFIHIQSTEGYDNLEQIQYTLGWRWEI